MSVGIHKELELFKSSLLVRSLSTFLMGALLTLAFAPFFCIFLVPFCLQGLLLSLNQSPTELISSKGFLRTYGFFPNSSPQNNLQVFLFFLGFFITSLHWVFYSFQVVNLTVYGPLAVVGLGILLSLIMTSAFLILLPGDFSTLSPTRKRLLLGVSFCLGEWLRGHIFTGFPWNLMGYAWYFDAILQVSYFIGIYGLTFLTIMSSVFLGPRYLKTSVLILMFWGLVFIFGEMRIKNYDQMRPKEPSINIRLVQPSIPQNEKWVKEKFWKNMERLVYLSNIEQERPLKLIIWPEASVATYLDQQKELLTFITQYLHKDTYLIVGAPRREDHKVFNSLFILNNKGQILGQYDKTHLTPFGEYIPFSSLIPFKKLTQGRSDFSAGKGPQMIKLDKIPRFIPLICYEAIFPGIPYRTKRWLLNITNDAWFGESIGPKQHLQIVRVRAIEEGVPLIRVANNGITAVIDGCGRIVQKLDTNEVGIIDEQLPHVYKSKSFMTIDNKNFQEIIELVLIVCLIFYMRWKYWELKYWNPLAYPWSSFLKLHSYNDKDLKGE